MLRVGYRERRSGGVGIGRLVLGIFLKRWRDGLPLEIHGSGEQRRDFIHVQDVADCNIAAFESGHHDLVLNVGSGTNESIRSLADMISDDQVVTPGRKGDARETLADISKTIELLNWRPKISLADGLAQLKELMLQHTDQK